ncbi:hypothetical protein QYF61_027125 [Mycteria americana]|uniref:Uncharacterized protein n=1 Tax=Mycteria americana TaxID=33587 RepID=A0AAN7NHJ8_MYCAM|nr:hypothetical protein QYF61_027125 [Mycteria americana]
MEKATLEQLHLKVTVAVDKSMPQQHRVLCTAKRLWLCSREKAGMYPAVVKKDEEPFQEKKGLISLSTPHLNHGSPLHPAASEHKQRPSTSSCKILTDAFTETLVQKDHLGTGVLTSTAVTDEAKQHQLPQPLLIRLVLQTLHQLRCPSLDMLQHLNVSLVVRGPKLNTVFEILSPIPPGQGGLVLEERRDREHLVIKCIQMMFRCCGGNTRGSQRRRESILTAEKQSLIKYIPKQILYDALIRLQDQLALDWSCPTCPPCMGWRLNHFPGQPVPMLDNPFSEEKFPNIQSKPPLEQLEAISSCPITCYLGEETDPHLSTTSFQVVVESNKVSREPPFLQAKQSQLPQPLLIRLVLQTLPQLRCPSLHTLQHLNIPLAVGGPKLNTVFEVRPHQCRVQGHDHFPSPAGHAIFDTSQDAIGFLGHLGTLLAHIQAAVNQHPQVLLCQAAFQPLFPKPVALHGVAVAQVQDLALGLVEPHTIDLGPSIQPVQVPLQSLPPLQQINTPTQLGVVCKLTESTLDPFVQSCFRAETIALLHVRSICHNVALPYMIHDGEILLYLDTLHITDFKKSTSKIIAQEVTKAISINRKKNGEDLDDDLSQEETELHQQNSTRVRRHPAAAVCGGILDQNNLHLNGAANRRIRAEDMNVLCRLCYGDSSVFECMLVGLLSQLLAPFESLQVPKLYAEGWLEHLSAKYDCECASVHQEWCRSWWSLRPQSNNWVISINSDQISAVSLGHFAPHIPSKDSNEYMVMLWLYKKGSTSCEDKNWDLERSMDEGHSDKEQSTRPNRLRNLSQTGDQSISDKNQPAGCSIASQMVESRWNFIPNLGRPGSGKVRRKYSPKETGSYTMLTSVASSGALSNHGLIHRSQSLRPEFTLEFQPVQSSSTEPAAMPRPSASPGTPPLLLSECSQAQQSKIISSTAGQQAAKAKSSH